MKGFLLGIVFTLLCIFIGGIILLRGGLISFAADQAPSALESKVAMAAVDKSTDRHAPELPGPTEHSEEDVVTGAKIYLNHCAGCHGLPSAPETQFMRSFYPPVPAFFKDAPDMSDKENYYIVQHGIRWTGMPAWNKTLGDQEIRQVVSFLGSIGKLSPSALKQLEIPSGSVPNENPGKR
jgi:mono/diheme cytochrome c family protein